MFVFCVRRFLKELEMRDSGLMFVTEITSQATLSALSWRRGGSAPGEVVGTTVPFTELWSVEGAPESPCGPASTPGSPLPGVPDVRFPQLC